MHINADMIRQLPDTGQRVPFLDLRSGYAHDDLISQLDVNRFVTVKIYLYNHNITLPFIICMSDDF